MMDKKIFRNVSYGMYIVSSKLKDKMSGCVINTFCQINSIDPIISISLNKDNYTNEVIRKSKKFAVSIISNDTSKEIIGKFGYQSSRDFDKFEGIDYEVVEDIPVVVDKCCGYFICEVINIIDCNTHDIMIAKVVDAKKLGDNMLMTYKYYTYVEDERSDRKESNIGSKYRCSLCGFIYDDDKEKVKFEDLPDNWCCPLCGAPKSSFEKII